MQGSVLVVLTALCSGLIATVITLFWQRKNHIKEEKRSVFKTLMSTRFDMTIEESVRALNMVDVVFYSSAKVRAAWNAFMSAADMPESTTRSLVIQDKHLRLLEVIAEDIGYNDIKWESIKHFYYPEGLFRMRNDEATLRRVQIDAAIAQINSSNGQQGVASVNPTELQQNQF